MRKGEFVLLNVRLINIIELLFLYISKVEKESLKEVLIIVGNTYK